jgi:hypothetical protein
LSPAVLSSWEFPSWPDGTRNVLPFVTGLIGFLGGLVVAMYNIDQMGSGPKVSKTTKNDDQKPSDNLGMS